MTHPPLSARHSGQLPKHFRLFLHWLSGFICWLFFALCPALAQQAIPPLSAHVMDKTGTLTGEQIQQLEEKLTAFEKDRGSQVVMLLVSSTQPEDIASYANRAANTWKIGRKEVGDGLLVIVAKNDRAVRIEVSKTLEGAIPDLAAKRVIEQAITPRFKQGDFAGGLSAAADHLTKLIAGEALPAPSTPSSKANAEFDWMSLAVFAFVAVPVVAAVTRAILGPKLGALITGGAVGALALLITASVVVAVLAGLGALLFALFANSAPTSRGGRGGFGTGGGGWSSGAGGGGFSSGGGGDFGGGGASGRW